MAKVGSPSAPPRHNLGGREQNKFCTTIRGKQQHKGGEQVDEEDAQLNIMEHRIITINSPFLIFIVLPPLKPTDHYIAPPAL